MRAHMEALIVENLKWMMCKAQCFCYTKEDAEDLVYDTVYKLLLYADYYKKGAPIRPWILQVMRNTYINWYNHRRKVLFTALGDYDVIGPNYADQSISMKQILGILRQCARKSCGVECVIMFAKGYTYDEIANALNVPIGTVKSRINTGRVLLDKLLDKEGKNKNQC